MIDADDYTVTVTHRLGTATSAIAHFSVSPAIAPTLKNTYPLDTHAYAHIDHLVSLYPSIASGSGPFTYQWLKNGTPLPGATDDTLFFRDPVLADAGSYAVIITNAAGSVTSRAATLQISFTSAPMILVQPVTRSVFEGANVSFSVAADGASMPGYRWQVRLANSTSL